MIFGDFGKALAQMDDRAFRRVLFLGLGLTIAALVAVYAGLLWLIDVFADEPIIIWGREITWLGDLLGWGSLFTMLFLSVFLMIPVASAVTSMFLEDVADAVEAKHYAHLPPAPRMSLWASIVESVNFFGLLIGANILAFIAYGLLPFATPFIFYGLNGYLLAREYFTLAAIRHEGRAGAKALFKQHRAEVWMAGVLMALPLTIPIMNLIIPILGAATFTHLYHRLARQNP